MKKLRLKLGFVGLFILTQLSMVAKETIAIINFDVIGSNYKESQYISMVTSEIRKLDTMDVVDKYTVAELVEARVLPDIKCFGVKCISDLGKELDVRGHAFEDTAAVISLLDLVITSDTSIAHLAGALGTPVWVMLPFAPDWRWGLRAETTPWYPNMRLFRQPKPNDWQAVVNNVHQELIQLKNKK